MVSVPTDAVESIHIPPGESELVAEGFENDDALAGFFAAATHPQLVFDTDHAASGRRSLRVSADRQPLVIQCPLPLDAARVQFWFQVERLLPSMTRTQMTFEFESSPISETFEIEYDGSRLSVANRQSRPAAWTTQSVELRSGWHQLTAVLTPQRLLCFVDESLLASGPGFNIPLRSLRLISQTGMQMDDLLISRLGTYEPLSTTRPAMANDLILKHDGDEYYGRIQRISMNGVTIHGIAEPATVPWSQIKAIRFHSSSRVVAAPAQRPEGLVAQIEYQPIVDRPQLRQDRLTATITATEVNHLIVSHPWLGEFSIAWRDIKRILPLFAGRTLVLDARRFHLGDSIQANFQRPLPDGHEWRGEFHLEQIPQGEVFLTLEAIDLEPCGPETPPGSPFLKELRRGRLLTEIIVNNQPAGDLNRYIRFRASFDKPERIRCPILPSVLKIGANTIRINQIPLKENGTDFDDFEFSNLRLELINPHAP
jgi:hypothetical protein